MASTPSTEASEIRRRGRRRLIGAVALVLLLVVFVPMILDPEPRPTRTEPALAIPPKDNAPPLPSPPPAAKADVPAEKASQGPAKAVVPAQAGTQDAAKAAQQPALEGFAVQVGAFRDEALLAQAREKLAAAGVVHYTERIDSAGGPLTRLRAGPFPTREAAEAALVKLKRSSLDGKVVAL